MNITWLTNTRSSVKTRVNNYDVCVRNVKDGVYNVSIICRDNRCLTYERGKGFHYFLTYDEARRYSTRFAGMISTLNRHVNKNEEWYHKHLAKEAQNDTSN